MIDIEQLLDAQRAWQAVSGEDEITARKIALESLDKCSDAIAVLGNNLKDIGYTWVVSEHLSSSLIERNILKLEKTLGFLIPEILVAFWQKVGSASFVDLDNYQHVVFWREQAIVGPGYFCDGLHIDPCSDEWAFSICDDFLYWRENHTSGESGDFLLSLSPDGYHKDNFRGGSPYGSLQNHPGNRPGRTSNGQAPGALSLRRQVRRISHLLEGNDSRMWVFPAFLGLPAFEPIRERLLLGVPVF